MAGWTAAGVDSRDEVPLVIRRPLDDRSIDWVLARLYLRLVYGCVQESYVLKFMYLNEWTVSGAFKQGLVNGTEARK